MTGIALTVEPREGSQEPFRLVFGGDSLTVGRGASCDVCLPDATVSARHAEIRREGRDWYVVDLCSTNGTRLNGTFLVPRVPKILRAGDALAVVGFRIAVELDVPVDDAAASSTALLGRRLVREVLARLHPGQAAPQLRVVAGPDAGRGATLDAVGAEVRIGRAEHCEIGLTDALASRDHAVVRRDLGGLALADLGGRNVTLVGGEPVRGERRLRDRDEIRVGNTRIVVSDPAEALVHELEQLPDEAWLPAPEPSVPPAPAPAPARPARAGRWSWEWAAVLVALGAVGGAAYLLYLVAQ